MAFLLMGLVLPVTDLLHLLIQGEWLFQMVPVSHLLSRNYSLLTLLKISFVTSPHLISNPCFRFQKDTLPSLNPHSNNLEEKVSFRVGCWWCQWPSNGDRELGRNQPSGQFFNIILLLLMGEFFFFFNFLVLQNWGTENRRNYTKKYVQDVMAR